MAYRSGGGHNAAYIGNLLNSRNCGYDLAGNRVSGGDCRGRCQARVAAPPRKVELVSRQHTQPARGNEHAEQPIWGLGSAINTDKSGTDGSQLPPYYCHIRFGISTRKGAVVAHPRLRSRRLFLSIYFYDSTFMKLLQ